MDEEKYLMVSLKEEKTKMIAEVINNKTCKKILNLLAESYKKELSQEDISKELKLPLNTVGYNIKKLVESSLIKESRNFFWSRKGKKIKMYKLSNKFIIIAPRKKSSNILKGLIPTVLISGAAAFLIKLYYSGTNYVIQKTFDSGIGVGEKTIDAVSSGGELGIESVTKRAPEFVNALNAVPSNVWLFFFLGALFGLLVFLILNWKNL